MRDRPAGRIGSLDGLRGIAAAVVLVHHVFLTIPAFSRGNYGLAVPSGVDWLVHSPAHLVWAGTEAVFVFFVLSGFVLTLPSLRRTQDWNGYYPSRLVRLYLPVVASVLLALALFLLVPRTSEGDQALWVNAHDEPLTLRGLLGDVTVVDPNFLNSPLWSLTWEVAFSILLPLYVSVAAVTRRWWWAVALIAIVLSAYGDRVHVEWLVYLPMFLLGSAMASGWEQIREVPKGWGWVLLVAALLGVTCSWWFPGWIPNGGVHQAVTLACAGTLVLLAGKWVPAERLLLGPVPRWLGRLSFSLYLVHEPILVSIANVVPRGGWWIVVVIGPPVAFGVAMVFSRLVELPAHRLAKRVATRVSEATRADHAAWSSRA